MAEKNELDESIVSAKQEHDKANHDLFQLAKLKRVGQLRAAQYQQQQKYHLQVLGRHLARFKAS